MKEPEWEVFAADETRMVLEALTRKAWLKKGARTVIKVKQSNDYQSYFGALNQKTFQWHAYEMSWQNQEEILGALDKLLKEYPNKKLFMEEINARTFRYKL